MTLVRERPCLEIIIKKFCFIFDKIQGPLPLEASLLGQRAMKCRAYAKALHYKEEEFHRNVTTETLESLIR